MVVQNNKNGLISQITIGLIILMGNIGISYILANKVANTMVIRDNVKIEELEKDMKVNQTDIAKLDEVSMTKDAFLTQIGIIAEQNNITRQMIVAHERRNDIEFIKLQNQYDILEKLFDKEIARFRGSSTISGGQIINR